jgi:anaerobic magnesium-protoporphyrin IX monomethyl ester cyclase
VRVLFVTHDRVSHEPLGLEYVSGALVHAGHETAGCQESMAIERAKQWQPDVVGFQVITGDQDRWGRVAEQVRQVVPGVRTMFGGPHYLFFTKAQQAGADIVIRGEAERSVVDAVEGRPWTDLVATNLDDLPPPDRDLFYNDDFPGIRDNPIRNFIACRGCPYKCTYCYNSNPEWLAMTAGTKRLRYHSPEWLAEDIGRTMQNYGGNLVSFQDDIFGIDLDWLERFERAYRRVRIPFFAQLRPYLITEDRVKLLKAAGIHIASFAIESGNEYTRAEVLDRRETNELILKGCDLLHRYGIKFRMQNLLGLPVDDPLADALETLRFNMTCKPTLSWCSLLQAYPGTAMAEMVVKRGLVPNVEALIPLVSAEFFDSSSLPIKNKRQIERLHKWWSAAVRWPWLYWLVRLLIYVPLGRHVESWIFEKTKQYINQQEYWRTKGRDAVPHVASTPLDRLGAELVRGA